MRSRVGSAGRPAGFGGLAVGFGAGMVYLQCTGSFAENDSATPAHGTAQINARSTCQLVHDPLLRKPLYKSARSRPFFLSATGSPSMLAMTR
jgi:hypothetical protein